MGILGNGDRAEQRQEMMDEQKRQNLHQQNNAGGGAAPRQKPPRQEYLEHLTESGVDEGTAGKMWNLLSKDFPLANADPEHVEELRWIARWIGLIVQRESPPQQSGIRGEYRKFLRDDPEDGLQPMGQFERVDLETTIMDIVWRSTRGQDGFQQKQQSTIYRVSEVKDNDTDSSSGRLWDR